MNLFHLVQKVFEERAFEVIVVLVHSGLVGAVVQCKLGALDQGYLYRERG